jgi:hypothetical protein
MFALDHSADLTPAHRFSEIASILAAGFVRFRAGSTAPGSQVDAVGPQVIKSAEIAESFLEDAAHQSSMSHVVNVIQTLMEIRGQRRSDRLQSEELRRLNTMRDSVKSNKRLSLLCVWRIVADSQRFRNLVKKAVVTIRARSLQER